MSLFPLLVALQFLTRLPVLLSRMPTPDESGRSLLWYPTVGLALGAFLVLLQDPLNHLSPSLQAALLLSFWVWISGGLHLDGLADMTDAWVGGHGDSERTLAIMKDPNCGPMGVLSLVLVLLVKFAALASLVAVEQWIGLLLAPWLGRWVLPLLLYSTRYVRAGGMGQVMVENMPRFWLPAILLLHGLAMLAVGMQGALAILCICVLGWCWRRVLIRRLGGTTGDTAGALVEISECLVLVMLAFLTA
ncbi:MAG TPA: adenosylcobinamide-GDP ribazoletransferase [Pseudomonas xinjiangensis]|uniref:Adenosylcobinamide-GDP ribazoletransferase n=2 Tax=root TaxID=1 RepID=A0A7V1BQC5_9GAMM|nr:adenosylcobinamide-GDP ribazoletransferase [Halopseudomonas xinjiangensis]HEC46173.1 adenosylcobinamide-GDP ribazoletransferase [Halopseudomonas xinjiangensis]